MKGFIKAAAAVIGLLSLVIIFALLAFIFLNRPTGLLQEPVDFRIEKGAAFSTVALKLEEQGLIRSRLFLRLYSRIKGTENALKSGLYRLSPGQTTADIHDTLVAGVQILYKVTIPEGWTMQQIAERLDEKGITPAQDFMAAASSFAVLPSSDLEDIKAEGFLYPDTYQFPLDYPAEKVVQHMVDTFFHELESIEPDYTAMTGRMLFETVTLASIVEREYRRKEEAALIAGVFYNRLEEGMALGSCATVVYVKTDILGENHPEKLTYDDLEIDSLYNTYQYRGLPPGPISNPGQTALKAAFHPEESDYLYFLVKDPAEGRHYFSRSYDEHNQAYQLYIK